MQRIKRRAQSRPGCSGDFLRPTTPAEKTPARRDQAEGKKFWRTGTFTLDIADQG
jgi:hypothetical protein